MQPDWNKVALDLRLICLRHFQSQVAALTSGVQLDPLAFQKTLAEYRTRIDERIESTTAELDKLKAGVE